MQIEELRVKAKEAYQENVGRPAKQSVATLQPINDEDNFPDPPPKETARVNVVAA